MTDIERDEWTIYCAWSLDGEEFPASVDPEPAPGEPFKVVRADAYQGAVDAYLSELVAESRTICEREGVPDLAEWIGKTVLARVTGEGQWTHG